MIEGTLNEEAVWKHVISRNGYAEPTFESTNIKVRWELSQRLVRNKRGEEIMSQAKVFCMKAVQADDVLEYRGQEWPVISVFEAKNLAGIILHREVSV